MQYRKRKITKRELEILMDYPDFIDSFIKYLYGDEFETSLQWRMEENKKEFNSKLMEFAHQVLK